LQATNLCTAQHGISHVFIIIKQKKLANNLSVLDTRKKNSITRLTKSSKIIKTIIATIHDKKGENVISLDLRKIPEAVADFFIVCEANNPTLLKAIADNIEHEVKEKCGELAYKHEGRQAQQWILIDYINVVIHVMLPETRKFYQLEEMWSDAVSTEHKEA
jgi:ribosome-associated protein